MPWQVLTIGLIDSGRNDNEKMQQVPPQQFKDYANTMHRLLMHRGIKRAYDSKSGTQEWCTTYNGTQSRTSTNRQVRAEIKGKRKIGQQQQHVCKMIARKRCSLSNRWVMVT